MPGIGDRELMMVLTSLKERLRQGQMSTTPACGMQGTGGRGGSSGRPDLLYTTRPLRGRRVGLGSEIGVECHTERG